MDNQQALKRLNKYVIESYDELKKANSHVYITTALKGYLEYLKQEFYKGDNSAREIALIILSLRKNNLFVIQESLKTMPGYRLDSCNCKGGLMEIFKK